MAPEVVERTVEGYDEAVDWWSLGVVTFELLTGCSPFTVDGRSNTNKDIAKWGFLVNYIEWTLFYAKFNPSKYMQVLSICVDFFIIFQKNTNKTRPIPTKR